MKTSDKYFYASFVASVAIHILVLTLTFVAPVQRKEPEFRELKIRIGVSKTRLERNKALSEGVKNSGDLANVLNHGAYVKKEVLASQVNAKNTTNLPNINTNIGKKIEESVKVSKKEKIAEVVKDKPKENPIKPEEKQEVKRVVERTSTELVMPEVEQELADLGAKSLNRPEIEVLGSPVGNSIDEDSGALVRYEQMLPLWLQKFKQYPKHARLLKLQGKGIIKITIARNGKVIKSQIEKSTGYAILDGALLDMIERADPVVPVPVDHLPEMNYLTYKMSVEFLPPVVGVR